MFKWIRTAAQCAVFKTDIPVLLVKPCAIPADDQVGNSDWLTSHKILQNNSQVSHEWTG